MDLYQILSTHSRPWSEREIMFFGILLAAGAAFLLAAAGSHRIRKSQAAGMMAMLVYIVVVLGSTVFTREVSERQCELIPLWSWRAVLSEHDWALLQEVMLNCVMLAPAGLLLPFAAGKKVRLRAGILLGILLSGVIEVSQFLFMRGLFEWDDMFHNTLGCVLGCAVSNALLAFRESRRAGDPSEGGAKE